MKRSADEELILMAQMGSPNDRTLILSRLNGFLPIIFIVLSGFIVFFSSSYISNSWRNKIQKTYTEKTENYYFDRIVDSLGTLERSAITTIGFLASSEEVTDLEFKIFLNYLIDENSNINFIQKTSFYDSTIIDEVNSTKNSKEVSNILTHDLISKILNSKSTNYNDGHFYLVSNPSNEYQLVVYAIPFTHKSLESKSNWLIAATTSKKITKEIADIDDHLELVFFEKAPKDIRSTELYAYKNLNFSIKTENDIFDSGQFDYLGLLLLGFSSLFTILLSTQFIFAKRTILNLAKIAIQRTSDLNSINDELVDEIMSRVQFQSELLEKTYEIEKANEKLEEVQGQLIQQEKLASIGQLAAGVAHEINNPVGFINSNLTMLKKYSERTLKLLEDIDNILDKYSDKEIIDKVLDRKKANKFDTIKKNLNLVIDESLEGLSRVKQIVQDLKDFSRIDEAEWQWADIHGGIDSTLNIAWNEIKYKAQLHKSYGSLPQIECVPSQINQVIMNLVVNSAHAIESSGNIYIRTSAEPNSIKIEVEDDGCGIPDKVINKIFDPFFTTKEIGKGTGLGLSLSYGIIKKHGGELRVHSTVGKGTIFTIILPIQQPINKEIPEGNIQS